VVEIQATNISFTAIHAPVVREVIRDPFSLFRDDFGLSPDRLADVVVLVRLIVQADLFASTSATLRVAPPTANVLEGELRDRLLVTAFRTSSALHGWASKAV